MHAGASNQLAINIKHCADLFRKNLRLFFTLILSFLAVVDLRHCTSINVIKKCSPVVNANQIWLGDISTGVNERDGISKADN